MIVRLNLVSRLRLNMKHFRCFRTSLLIWMHLGRKQTYVIVHGKRIHSIELKLVIECPQIHSIQWIPRWIYFTTCVHLHVAEVQVERYSMFSETFWFKLTFVKDSFIWIWCHRRMWMFFLNHMHIADCSWLRTHPPYVHWASSITRTGDF